MDLKIHAEKHQSYGSGRLASKHTQSSVLGGLGKEGDREEADAILGLAAGGRKPVHGPLGLRVVPGQWLAPGLWRFPGKGAIHPQEEPTRR